MDLREALEVLAQIPQPTERGSEAREVLAKSLFTIPKKHELALWPAEQAKALVLMDSLQEALGGIVYDLARAQVQQQMADIAKDASAARAKAEQAMKGYQATRKTWDALAARLENVERELQCSMIAASITEQTAKRRR